MSLTDTAQHTRHTHSLHLGNHTLCRIYVVQTIILTRNVIVGVVRVIFVVVGRGRRGRQGASIVGQPGLYN